MFNKYNHDKNYKGHEHSIEKPNIDELYIRSCWQLFANGALQSIHDKHRGDGQWNRHLEVLLEEIDSCLLEDHK